MQYALEAGPNAAEDTPWLSKLGAPSQHGDPDCHKCRRNAVPLSSTNIATPKIDDGLRSLARP